MKKILVVDFDGTIVEHAFPEIGELKPGVIEALTKLQKHYHIVISSCRNNAYLNNHNKNYHEEMKNFLIKAAIPFDEIDEGDQGKFVAHIYIDDRAIRFKNNWPEIAAILVQRGIGK